MRRGHASVQLWHDALHVERAAFEPYAYWRNACGKSARPHSTCEYLAVRPVPESGQPSRSSSHGRGPRSADAHALYPSYRNPVGSGRGPYGIAWYHARTGCQQHANVQLGRHYQDPLPWSGPNAYTLGFPSGVRRQASGASAQRRHHHFGREIGLPSSSNGLPSGAYC